MKKIKNNDTIDHTWCGQIITPGSIFTISPSEEIMWANDSTLLLAILDGTAVVNCGIDGTVYTDPNTAINFMKGISAEQLPVIQSISYHIRLGKLFSLDHIYILQNAATHDHAIVTPDTTTSAHLYCLIEASQDVEFLFYESPTITLTTEIVPINRNRNSSNVNTVKIYDFSVISALGTLISHRRFGMGQGTGNNITSTTIDDEIILKRNTTYFLRIKSNANGNILSTSTRWYEHIDTGS